MLFTTLALYQLNNLATTILYHKNNLMQICVILENILLELFFEGRKPSILNNSTGTILIILIMEMCLYMYFIHTNRDSV